VFTPHLRDRRLRFSFLLVSIILLATANSNLGFAGASRTTTSQRTITSTITETATATSTLTTTSTSTTSSLAPSTTTITSVSTTISTTSPTQNSTNEEACSYQVFTNGTATYAQNCDTGSIEYSSTNPTTAINSAISALTSGGKIFIKAGTYTFTTTPITLNGNNAASIGTTTVSGIELYGEGTSTILTAGPNTNGIVLGVMNVNGWYIHDLQINGNRAQQSASGNGSGATSGLVGIDLFNSNNDTIQHCYVHDDKTYGIYVFGTHDSILNNYVEYGVSNGIMVAGGSNYLIQGNIESGSSDVGIDVWGAPLTSGSWPLGPASNVIVIGNTVLNSNYGQDPWDQNTGIGICLGDGGAANHVVVSDNVVYNAVIGIDTEPGSSQTNYDVQILNNNINDTSSYGIQAYGPTASLAIENNVIDNSASSGIFLYQATDVTVSGNHFINIINYGIYDTTPNVLIQDNHFDGGLGSGNYGVSSEGVYTNAAYTSIIGNTFVGAYRSYAAIEFDSDANYGHISGNTISPTSNRGCIMLAGTNNEASDNQVYGATVGVEVSSTASGSIVSGNDLVGDTYPVSGAGNCYSSGAVTAASVVLENNVGYNPVKRITTPISGSTLVDSGSSSTWVSATVYTNWQSPKILYVSGGTVTVIAADGVTLYTAATTCTITLQPGDTFEVTFTVAPTIIVFGQ